MFFLPMVVPAKHGVGEVHFALLPVSEASNTGKIELALPAMSINLMFLSAGSAAALATTVTGIPLSRHGGSKGWAGSCT